MELIEQGFNPIALGYQFGYIEPDVIRRIDELAQLKDGWHFGAGKRPSNAVLALAKAIATYAISCGFSELDAFPSRNGDVTIALYQDDEDHSFQVRSDLSFRYWQESDPDGEIEEGLSSRVVMQKIRELFKPPWNSFSSFISSTGTVATNIFAVKPSKIRVTGVVYLSSSWIAYTEGAAGTSAITRGFFIEPSVQSPQSSGDLTNQSCQLATR